MYIHLKGFDFWKDNKIAGHYSLTETELRETFKTWLRTKEKAWIDYYSSERAIRLFITEGAGLNSAFEEKDFDAMYRCLSRVYLNHH